MFKNICWKAIKAFFTTCLRFTLILVLFRVFVLTFGILFSSNNDFYSYSLVGKQPLSFWIFFIVFILILSFILSFIDSYIEKHKNNKK